MRKQQWQLPIPMKFLKCPRRYVNGTEVPAKRRLAALIAAVRGKTQPKEGVQKGDCVLFVMR